MNGSFPPSTTRCSFTTTPRCANARLANGAPGKTPTFRWLPYAPNARFEDPAFRLLFARLVTHYWKNAAFLEEDQLIRDASVLEGIPSVLIHGRYDVSGPLETTWRLHKDWRGSELHVVEDAGHGGGSMAALLISILNRLGGG